MRTFEIKSAAAGTHESGTKFYELYSLCCLDSGYYYLLRRYGPVEKYHLGGASMITREGLSAFNKLAQDKERGGYNLRRDSRPGPLGMVLPGALVNAETVFKHFGLTTQISAIKNYLGSNDSDEFSDAEPKPPEIEGWGAW